MAFLLDDSRGNFDGALGGPPSWSACVDLHQGEGEVESCQRMRQFPLTVKFKFFNALEPRVFIVKQHPEPAQGKGHDNRDCNQCGQCTNVSLIGRAALYCERARLAKMSTDLTKWLKRLEAIL